MDPTILSISRRAFLTGAAAALMPFLIPLPIIRDTVASLLVREACSRSRGSISLSAGAVDGSYVNFLPQAAHFSTWVRVSDQILTVMACSHFGQVTLFSMFRTPC